MIIEPGDDQTQEQVAEEALWRTFERRLEQDEASEALLYLRHLIKALPASTESQGGFVRHRFGLYQRVSEYSATYNAVTGERMSWFFDLLRGAPERVLDADACLKAAREVAQPPEGAKLEAARFEEQGEDTVFLARWSHEHDGIPVERDYIQVLVNPDTGEPFAHHRKWHEIDVEPTER